MNGTIVRMAGKLLGGVLLLGLAAPGRAATVEYIHTDALGSPVAVTDSNGVVIERREYEPYGRQLSPTPVADGPGYTGHVSDAATGLDYMQQRYYDPSIGRFLSADPIRAGRGIGIGSSRYSYASNNPYSLIDPDGRQACGRNTTCQLAQGASGGTIQIASHQDNTQGETTSSSGRSPFSTSESSSTDNSDESDSESEIQDFGQIVVVAYPGEFHDEVVRDLVDALKLGGANVLTEVKLCFGGVCSRIDIFGRDPIGNLFAVEVKTGMRPRFTNEQLAVYPHLKSGFLVTAPDQKVSRLGLPPGVELPPVSGLLWYRQNEQSPGYAVPFP